MTCPYCQSADIVKNGSNSSGKQKFKCKNCGRQSVENPENRIISQATKDLTENLLLEKIPLAGIVRASKVSRRRLQYYVNDKYGNIPREMIITEKQKGQLTTECDEMWSFVGSKDDRVWIWLAKDIDTGETAGVHTGHRDREGAQKLWYSLPGVYRQCAVSCTDFRSAYEEVFPSVRHRPAGKGSGKTNHIESFNCSMRQRISRPVRKTLSFSEKMTSHIGAIWNFIHHCNALLA